MKLYRNWIINEVARAGEHTNERTYVRTYSHTYVRDRPYIPSTTLLCEGIINGLIQMIRTVEFTDQKWANVLNVDNMSAHDSWISNYHTTVFAKLCTCT